MLAKQTFRVNFLALFLLISGLTGLIGSNRALAFADDSESDDEMAGLLRAPSGRASSSRAVSTANLDGLADSISRMSVRLVSDHKDLDGAGEIAREFSSGATGLQVISDAPGAGVSGDSESKDPSRLDSARAADLGIVAAVDAAEIDFLSARDRRIKRGRGNSGAGAGYVADVDDIGYAGSPAQVKKARKAVPVGQSRTTDDLPAARYFGDRFSLETGAGITSGSGSLDVPMRDIGSGRAGAGEPRRIIVRRRKPVAASVGDSAMAPVALIARPVGERVRAMSL